LDVLIFPKPPKSSTRTCGCHNNFKIDEQGLAKPNCCRVNPSVFFFLVDAIKFPKQVILFSFKSTRPIFGARLAIAKALSLVMRQQILGLNSDENRQVFL